MMLGRPVRLPELSDRMPAAAEAISVPRADAVFCTRRSSMSPGAIGPKAIGMTIVDRVDRVP